MGILEGLSPLLAPGPIMPFVVCTLAEEVQFTELLDLQSLSLEGDLESDIPCLILALVRHRIFLLMWTEMLLQLEPKALLILVHYLCLAL